MTLDALLQYDKRHGVFLTFQKVVLAWPTSFPEMTELKFWDDSERRRRTNWLCEGDRHHKGIRQPNGE
ncbi:hypothetical protein ANO14919_135580 [Xylariales sp. No.14919]|nr:hypothetical protein ANO14919_135580 [Xylariales sp. No.14919]